ncbi:MULTISPECIES: prolipoprotein diacylglyceryl transferase [Ruminococcus]|uniref:Phosphatidylglycerol--prolipoprotein diacylglyceryl transferase n=1 Tax=Ruminococcus albus 8 TaxID=246199 RepID=E9SEE9_RUMAL|nr:MULTISPECIES: prolipoprotein diacylglyceryl transferase [Ruminococcus]EGC02388.1 prolipoprotein diacylglyceryl transferase [Ruminococcus albus 8]MBQ9542506.1 prolipoprotein diacylglyceryl transferase [Ruminococcus sp.]MCC3351199.1 prolipoprotein diacylglyceryl transferase [Ruminococcus albus 8]
MNMNVMTALTALAEDTAAVREKLRANPDKVYFPNFGGGDNILKEGISIDRVAFTVPGLNFTVYWYGLLIGIGMLLAIIYGFRKMRPCGIDPDRATDSVISGIIGAIIGARLYYIIFNTEGMKLTDFFKIRDGGLAIYGGLIGAILVGGIVTKLRGLRLSAMLDVTAPCFLIGQCIGRWGNFFNQEAFGANTDKAWGMLSWKTAAYISDHYDTLTDVDAFKPIHPCFLYESLWCLLGFVLLHLYFKHRKFDGEIFLMYTFWYGLGRFFIEGLRTDSLYLGHIRVSQLVAGTCVVASVILWIVFRSSVKRSDSYKFFCETEVSKAQLAEFTEYEDMQKEKKELKKKIDEAKHKGESFAELEKEYEKKFGKEAVKAKKQALKDAASKDKEKAEKPDDGYKSILADDEDEKENND